MNEFFTDIDRLEKLVLDEVPVGTGKMSSKKKSASQSYVEFLRLQQHNAFEPDNQPVQQAYKMVSDVVAAKPEWRKVPRFENVLLRQGLLEYSSSTTPIKQKLIGQLKAKFGGAKRTGGGDDGDGKADATVRPSTLVVSTARLLKKTWETNQIGKLELSDERHKIENTYTPAAQEFLANQNLNSDQITSFMRLMDSEAPEIPYLLTFVKRDLTNNKTPFGRWDMHKRLTLKQMELLGKKTKELDGCSSFWETYCWKLQSVHAYNLDTNLTQRGNYLGKLKKFCAERDMIKKCTGLRAIVLYNYMTHLELTTGKYDKAALIAYLTIPRERGYNSTVLPTLLKKGKVPMCPYDYKIDDIPILKPIGDDQPFVRRALSDFFRTATESYPKWTHLVDASWVKVLYTETRLMSRQGNEVDLKKELLAESGKYAYTDLRDRVEITVCADNKVRFDVEDRVEIDLFIKNVKELQVDVFELNPLEYYNAYGKEMTLELVLDGLAPTDTRMMNVKQADPIIRKRQNIKLPAIGNRNGVWLVEFVGNCQRTRCIVRKGELRYVAKTVDVDQKGRNVCIVVLENNKPVKEPRVWVGGQCYTADESGNILCDYSQDHDDPTPFVVEDKTRPGSATLHFMKFPRSVYSLKCGLYVDRESLLARQTAKCIVRPALFVDEEPCSIKNLLDCRLTLTCETVTERSTKVISPTLQDDREFVYELTVPNELRHLTMTLEGNVQRGGKGPKSKLQNVEKFSVNLVDDSEFLGDLHLIPRGASGYVLAAFGKNGEPYANQVVDVKLEHRYFQRDLKHKLETNEEGLIFLGRLPDVKRIKAQQAEGGKMYPDEHSWELLEDKVNVPMVVNVAEKDVVRIPFMSADSKGPKVDVYDTKYIQKFKNVSYRDGYVEIRNLPVGDFIAHLRDIQNINVEISVGNGTRLQCGGFDHMVSGSRIVELSEEMPLQITVVKGNRDKGYRVQLQGHNENTRVHILSTYLVPRYTSFSALASPMVKPHLAELQEVWNTYGQQTDLAEEFIYVSKRRDNLEARGNEKLGVALPVPSMVQTPVTTRDPIQAHPKDPAPAPPKEAPKSRQKARHPREALTVLGAEKNQTSDSCNLEWLAEPSMVVQNLLPDAQGWVAIPTDSVMKSQNVIQIIATDDNNISLRNVILPTTASTSNFKDCRLTNALNPKDHLAEIREILFKYKGEAERFENWETSQIETVDDISDVFELYLTMAQRRSERERAHLAKFFPLTVWNELSHKERLQFYGDMRCHEVNFWLYRKDPDFFSKVVQPLLAGKVQKDMMDSFLLGDRDALMGFTKSRWHTLNVLERILVDASCPRPGNDERYQDLLLEADAKPRSISRLDKLFRDTVESKNMARMREGSLLAEISTDAEPKKLPKFDLTNIFEESRYYQVSFENTTSDLLTPNDFWCDFATYMRGGAKGPFLSKNYGYASSNLTEMLLSLACLDLDYRVNVEALEPVKVYPNGATAHVPGMPVEVRFRVPTILLSKQLKVRPWDDTALSVSTNYFDPDAKKVIVDGETEDKFLDPNNLHTQKVYGCRVVVTNVSSQQYEVEVLTQIPEGAIPVRKGHKTRNQIVTLEPFQTTVVPYYFYFPTAGTFCHWPAHVNMNGKVLGFDMKTVPLNVVDPHKIEDTSSWNYMCTTAEFQDLMAYIRTDAELPRRDLDLLAPRGTTNLKQFKEITSALRGRHMYNEAVWRSAFNYGPDCRDEIEEYLNLNVEFQEYMSPCFGNALRTDAKRPLGAFDPLVRKKASYNEFWTSDGTAGKNGKWVTDRPGVSKFDTVYHKFLLTALCRSFNLNSMSVADRMTATYYMILMNKTSEAQRIFDSIPAQADNQLYDYMKGYLTIHADATGLMSLSALTGKYLKSSNIGPELRAKWKALENFVGELRSSADFDSEFVYESEEEKRLRTEKILEITNSGEGFMIKYKNIEKVRVKLYKIDIELMFSTAPFTRDNNSYRYVEPTKDETKDLTEVSGVLPLEEILGKLESDSGENFLFEVLAEKEDICVNDSIYLNAFNVQKSDREIRVLRKDGGTPVVKAYVKVYAKTASDPAGVFYKDGYTDLRGRFDYRTVSSNALDHVDRFAILIKTISNGANVMYIEPSSSQ